MCYYTTKVDGVVCTTHSNRNFERKIVLYSNSWFRSRDFRVMSPARFHCVKLLCFIEHCRTPCTLQY